MNDFQYYGVEDKVYFTHSKDTGQELTDDDLITLYNTMDVMINTGGGEGWGLTSAEGAACGIPQLVPDWSATRELWSQHGILLPVKDYRCEPKFLNTCHAIIDTYEAATELLHLAESEERLHFWRQRALEWAGQQPTWTDVGRKFERAIYKALEEEPVNEVKIQDLMGQTTAKSECRTWH